MTMSASASRRTTGSAPIRTEWPLGNPGLIGGSPVPDWRRDLNYDLMWEPRWSSWRLPTPLWFWDETAQPRFPSNP
jgi:hypothetical protein